MLSIGDFEQLADHFKKKKWGNRNGMEIKQGGNEQTKKVVVPRERHI